MFPKPEVYHDRNCPLAKEKLHKSQQNEQSKLSSIIPQIPQNIKNMLRNPLNKSESVCSCGHGPTERPEKIDSEPDNMGSVDKKTDKAEVTLNKDIVSDLADVELHDAIADVSDKGDIEKEPDKREIEGAGEDERIGKGVEAGATGNISKTSPRLGRGPKKLSVSFSIPDSDKDMGVKMADIEGEIKEDDENRINEKVSDSGNKESGGNVGEETKDGEGIGENDADVNGGTRIGSIRYMAVEEDSNGHVSLQSMEKTQTTLSKLSADEFAVFLKSDSNLAEASVGRTENRDVEKTRSSSTSSLGPFSPTPHLSAFVNYATGFFQKHPSDSSIKDIKDVIFGSIDNVTDTRQTNENKTESANRRSDIPVIAAAPTGRKRGRLSRHSDHVKSEIAVESAVRMDEKADLFNVDYSRK